MVTRVLLRGVPGRSKIGHDHEVAYRLSRPESIEGVGPLRVYRAISVVQQDLRQVPMRAVQSMSAYNALSQDMTPRAAVTLARASVAYVPKVWTELAYEEVRKQVAPGAPSRLTSVYACPDVFEAFSFTEETGTAQRVWAGDIESGVRWRLVDMSHFSVPPIQGDDEAAYAEAWDQAQQQAQSYWAAASDQVSVGEILVDGALLLGGEQLRLIPEMRRLGLID